VLFILDDGRQVEYRNQKYSYYCMLEKPETMSIYIYFILALNRYAAGATFTDYFTSLHEYIQEYLDFFPEYTRQFQYMTAALANYVAAECTDQSTTDQAKIETIQKLLEIVPEELLLLLIEY